MGDRSLATLAFFLFQLVTFVLFLRPSEMIESFATLPIYEGLMLGCLVLTIGSMEPHFRKQALVRQPISICVVGIFVSTIISHLQHMYLGGVLESSEIVLKVLIYYGLLITIVNSPGRLRAYLTNLAVCSSLMCTLCLLDFWEIVDFQHITHLMDTQGHDDDYQPILIARLRGIGLFQDPNDMAMIIVASGTLCIYQLTSRDLGSVRFAWLVPIVILTVALFETKSRGGLLAAGCAALMLSQFWFGPRVAAVFAVLGALILPLVAGRSGEIDLEDGGTAHERVLMWRDGFHALKSPDFLFGVGQGMYGEIADLVAHNSFVHAYVELGAIGGTMFFGCFFFAGLQLYRMGQMSDEIWAPELERMRPYLATILAGWCGSILSLSRCYIVPTYLIIGLMAAYSNLVWIHTETCRPLVIWNRQQAVRLFAASALAFLALYAFTIVYA